MEIVMLATEDEGYDTSAIRENYDFYLSKIDEILTQIRNTNSVPVIRYDPIKVKELSILENYMSSLEIIDPDNIVEYTSEFRDIVNSSNISESSKMAICGGISVALASDELWNITE